VAPQGSAPAPHRPQAVPPLPLRPRCHRRLRGARRGGALLPRGRRCRRGNSSAAAGRGRRRRVRGVVPGIHDGVRRAERVDVAVSVHARAGLEGAFRADRCDCGRLLGPRGGSAGGALGRVGRGAAAAAAAGAAGGGRRGSGRARGEEQGGVMNSRVERGMRGIMGPSLEAGEGSRLREVVEQPPAWAPNVEL